MIEAIWTIVKIAIVAAVGYAVIRWILGKAGLWQPLLDAIGLGVLALRKWLGW